MAFPSPQLAYVASNLGTLLSSTDALLSSTDGVTGAVAGVINGEIGGTMPYTDERAQGASDNESAPEHMQFAWGIRTWNSASHTARLPDGVCCHHDLECACSVTRRKMSDAACVPARAQTLQNLEALTNAPPRIPPGLFSNHPEKQEQHLLRQ